MVSKKWWENETQIDNSELEDLVNSAHNFYFFNIEALQEFYKTNDKAKKAVRMTLQTPYFRNRYNMYTLSKNEQLLDIVSFLIENDISIPSHIQISHVL